MQVKHNQHLSVSRLSCQRGGAGDERRTLLTWYRTNGSQIRSGRGSLNKLSVFYSRWEFRIVNLIRWCAITVQKQRFVGHAETLQTLFSPFLISLVSPPLCLSLTVTACFPLCSQSSPEAAGLNLTFTHHQTAENNMRKRISNT